MSKKNNNSFLGNIYSGLSTVIKYPIDFIKNPVNVLFIMLHLSTVFFGPYLFFILPKTEENYRRLQTCLALLAVPTVRNVIYSVPRVTYNAISQPFLLGSRALTAAASAAIAYGVLTLPTTSIEKANVLSKIMGNLGQTRDQLIIVVVNTLVAVIDSLGWFAGKVSDATGVADYIREIIGSLLSSFFLPQSLVQFFSFVKAATKDVDLSSATDDIARTLANNFKQLPTPWGYFMSEPVKEKTYLDTVQEIGANIYGYLESATIAAYEGASGLFEKSTLNDPISNSINATSSNFLTNSAGNSIHSSGMVNKLSKVTYEGAVSAAENLQISANAFTSWIGQIFTMNVTIPTNTTKITPPREYTRAELLENARKIAAEQRNTPFYERGTTPYDITRKIDKLYSKVDQTGKFDTNASQRYTKLIDDALKLNQTNKEYFERGDRNLNVPTRVFIPTDKFIETKFSEYENMDITSPQEKTTPKAVWTPSDELKRAREKANESIKKLQEENEKGFLSRLSVFLTDTRQAASEWFYKSLEGYPAIKEFVDNHGSKVAYLLGMVVAAIIAYYTVKWYATRRHERKQNELRNNNLRKNFANFYSNYGLISDYFEEQYTDIYQDNIQTYMSNNVIKSQEIIDKFKALEQDVFNKRIVDIFSNLKTKNNPADYVTAYIISIASIGKLTAEKLDEITLLGDDVLLDRVSDVRGKLVLFFEIVGMLRVKLNLN